MKTLNDFENYEILVEQEVGQNFVYLINEKKSNTLQFALDKNNFTKSFKKFVKENPILAGAAIGIGLDYMDTYNRNKRLTTRFFATNQQEKNLYQKMSDDLVKTGKYRLIRTKRLRGGTLFELKRNKV